MENKKEKQAELAGLLKEAEKEAKVEKKQAKGKTVTEKKEMKVVTKKKPGRPKGSKNEKAVVKKETPTILMKPEKIDPKAALGTLSQEDASFIVGCVDPQIVGHKTVSGSAGIMGLRVTLSYGDVEMGYKVHGVTYNGRQEKLRGLHPQAKLRLAHSPMEKNPYNVYVVQEEGMMKEVQVKKEEKTANEMVERYAKAAIDHKEEIRFGVLGGIVIMIASRQRRQELFSGLLTALVGGAVVALVTNLVKKGIAAYKAQK